MTVLASPDWLLLLPQTLTLPVDYLPDVTLQAHGWWRTSDWHLVAGDSAWHMWARVEAL